MQYKICLQDVQCLVKKLNIALVLLATFVFNEITNKSTAIYFVKDFHFIRCT